MNRLIGDIILGHFVNYGVVRRNIFFLILNLSNMFIDRDNRSCFKAFPVMFFTSVHFTSNFFIFLVSEDACNYIFPSFIFTAHVL